MNPNFTSISEDQNLEAYNPNTHNAFVQPMNDGLQKLHSQSPTPLQYGNIGDSSTQDEPISADSLENSLKIQLQIGVNSQPTVSVKENKNDLTNSPKSTSEVYPVKRQDTPQPSNEDFARAKQQRLAIKTEPINLKNSTNPSIQEIDDKNYRREVSSHENITYTTSYGKGSTRPKVNSNTITLYQTDAVFNAGKLITTSNNYLLWGVRGGSLRAFHKFNCKNAIMKGHKQQVMDVKFYHHQSNLVASVSRDRSLILWEVSERKQKPSTPNGAPESTATQQKDAGLGYKVQLYVKPPEDQSHRFFKRIEWLPRRDARILFAVTSVNEVIVINLDVLMAKAVIMNDIRFCHFANDIEGVTVIHASSEDVINDIRFSTDQQTELFAAVTESGKIILWNSNTLNKVYEQNLYHDGTALWSIQFCGSKVRPNLYNSFIVGTHNNTQFTLWRFMDRNFSSETSITKVQTVTIVATDNAEHSQGSPRAYTNTVELDSSSSCLFAANLEMPTLFAIHIGEDRIDHVAEFETNYPIISFKTMTKFDEQDKNFVIGLFCLESEAVQLISITINDILTASSGNIQKQQIQAKEEEEEVSTTEQKQTEVQMLSKPMPQNEIEPLSRNNAGSANINVMLKEMKKMEKRITTRMEEMIDKQTQKQFDNLYHRLERERLLRVKEERQKQEELLDTIAKAVSQDIPEDVAAVIEQRILPTIGNELQRRLDEILQQSFDRKAQSIGPIIEQSMMNSIRQPIQESFQQVLKQTVIPSFQLSCQKMFTQISQTFESGMEERIKKPLREYYAGLNQETLQLIDQHLKQFAANTSYSNVSYGSQSPQAIPSHQTIPPTTTTSQKDQILHLLRASKFDEAFTIALSCNDLKLVTWTCENSSPDQVLSFLSQAVLLSLIQQLSFDLKTNLDLKLEWIEKAILLLDPNDRFISAHVQPILQSVLAGLQRAFTENAEPSNPRSSKLKLLMHVVNSQLYGAASKKE